MKTLVSFLSEPVAVALGWTLLHALWQGFALVLPAALLMYMFRRKSSQLRYTVGVGALLAQVAISVATFSWYYQPVVHTGRASAKTLMTTTIAPPAIWPMVSRSLPWHLQAQRFLEMHLTEIVVCWLIGVAVFLIRLAGGWFYVQRLKTTALQPADAFWQSAKKRLSAQLGVRQSVQVLESMHVVVPMVVGALKPVILLPVGLIAGLSMQEAEAILAHELAHVKRFDYGVNLLQSVVEVVYFFHPALWWLSARVREERENCCDDLAVLACGNARSLAQALARVEEFSQTPVLAMALASQKKLLLNRVRRMLGVSARPVVSNGHLLVLTLATLLLATVSVYAIQQEPQPKPRKVQSLSTRAHKTPNGTEFGITDNHKVDYVIWGGQKLPAKRVASLQSQLDKVKAGQLSLDNVPQADRDILLAIIETNQSLDTGMDGLAKGLVHIDADNIAIASLDGMSVSLEAKLADLKATYDIESKLKLAELEADAELKLAELENGYANKELNSAKLANEALLKVVQAQSNGLLRQAKGNADSLQAVREQNRSKAAVIRLQMEKQRFAVDAIRRKMEVVSYDKMRLEQQRLQATMKQRQILMKSRTAQADADRETAAKQIAENEQVIQQQEAAIEKNAQQLIELQNQLMEAQKPIQEAETQLQKLGVSGRQSFSIGAQSIGIGDMDFEMPDMPEIPEVPEMPDMPEVYVNGYTNTYRSPRAAVTGRTIRGAIAPKIAIPARPARPAMAPPSTGRLDIPAPPPSPAVAPFPMLRETKSAKPAATPKPATAPAPKSTNN